ncbi:UNVERIFIED_CONTAM: hypothetical protein RKD50_008105 [Streptomyces canus]
MGALPDITTVTGTPKERPDNASTTTGRSATTAIASTDWSVSRRRVSMRSAEVLSPCLLARLTQ